MRKLSDIDRQSILNPIVDALGIINNDTKERIINNVEDQLNRILCDYIKVATDDMSINFSNNINQLSGKQEQFNRTLSVLNTNVSHMSNILSTMSTNLSKIIETLINEVILLKKEINPDMVLDDKDEIQIEEEDIPDNIYTDISLSKLKFVELSKISKEIKIDIPYRCKKKEMINLILKKQKELINVG